MTVSTHSLVNQACATFALALAVLRTALLAAGWTQEGSGDGSTFSNAGAGPVTGGGSGVAGLDGTGRWMRFRDPSGIREIILFRGGSATTWSLVYSFAARFTGGSPAAAQRPTATDEVAIFTNQILSLSATSYAHAVVEDTAINGAWGFWFMTSTQATSARTNFFACDVLAAGAVNSRYAALGSIVDPCVWLNGLNAANPNLSPTAFNTGAIFNLFAAGTPSASLLALTSAQYDSGGGNLSFSFSGTLTQGLPVSAWDGGDDIAAMIYSRMVAIGAPGIALGISHHMSAKGIPARNYPDVVQDASLDFAWVYWSTFAIPWPKGTTPSP